MKNRYVVTLFFFFMLGLNMVLPVFTKQDSYTIFNVFQKEEKPTPVADDDVTPFIYIEHVVPPGSFGCGNYTDQLVNWSWINNNTRYTLTRDTVNVTSTLHVNFSTVFTGRKYSYDFTAGAKGYFLFTLVFNSHANSSYISTINNTVFFNYSDGQLFYNFSDIAGIQQIDFTRGLSNNVFTMTVGKQCNKNVHVVLDPTFGDITVVGTSTIAIEDIIYGGYFQMGAVDGTGDSITAKVRGFVDGQSNTGKCALYNADNTLVTNSETEEEEIPYHLGNDYHTFNFGATKPILVANAWYWIVIWADTTAGIPK